MEDGGVGCMAHGVVDVRMGCSWVHAGGWLEQEVCAPELNTMHACKRLHARMHASEATGNTHLSGEVVVRHIKLLQVGEQVDVDVQSARQPAAVLGVRCYWVSRMRLLLMRLLLLLLLLAKP